MNNWGVLRQRPFDTGELEPETIERWMADNRRAAEGEVILEESSLVTIDSSPGNGTRIVAELPVVEDTNGGR